MIHFRSFNKTNREFTPTLLAALSELDGSILQDYLYGQASVVQGLSVADIRPTHART